MFLFLSQIAILDAAVHLIEAIRERDEWIATLPKDEQDAIREKDLQESKWQWRTCRRNTCEHSGGAR